MRTPLLVVPVLLLALAGCGSDPSTVAAPAATTSPSPVGSTADPTAPGKGALVVTGTVSAGVEAGCTVLTSGATTYLLLGDVDTALVGREVRAQGVLEPDAVTTCQQGTALRITTLTPR